MLPRRKISGRIIKRRIILREEVPIARGRILAVGTIAAAKIAVAKIVDRIRVEDAAADSGAVADADAVDVLRVELLAGAICRRQNMLRRKGLRFPGNRAGRIVATIEVMIGAMTAVGRVTIAEAAGSNRVDLKIAGRKIPGMAQARWDRISMRAKNRFCCRVNRWRNIAGSRRRLRLLRWWNRNR
jgi:hypothetical protein